MTIRFLIILNLSTTTRKIMPSTESSLARSIQEARAPGVIIFRRSQILSEEQRKMYQLMNGPRHPPRKGEEVHLSDLCQKKSRINKEVKLQPIQHILQYFKIGSKLLVERNPILKLILTRIIGPFRSVQTWPTVTPLCAGITRDSLRLWKKRKNWCKTRLTLNSKTIMKVKGRVCQYYHDRRHPRIKGFCKVFESWTFEFGQFRVWILRVQELQQV